MKDEIIKWAYKHCNMGGEIDMTELVGYLLNIKVYDKNGRYLIRNVNKIFEYIKNIMEKDNER